MRACAAMMSGRSSGQNNLASGRRRRPWEPPKLQCGGISQQASSLGVDHGRNWATPFPTDAVEFFG
jgi:hypothetical protein